MQVQSGLSLFDYLDNPKKSQQSLQQLADSGPGNMRADLTALGQTSRDQIDETLQKMQSGESSVRLQTLDNMIAYNLRPVAAELQELADRFNLSQPLDIQQTDEGLKISADAADDTEAKGLQRMQQYLDSSQPLQKKLDQLSRLSEMYELGKSREFAAELKAQGVGEQKVVDFLANSREHIKAHSAISLSDNAFNLDSRGQAQRLFDATAEQ